MTRYGGLCAWAAALSLNPRQAIRDARSPPPIPESIMTENTSSAPRANVRVYNNGAASDLAMILAVIGWLAGMAAAKGFVSTAAAIVFFPYGWYLAVETVMRAIGLLP